jgi:hypothetical protein
MIKDILDLKYNCSTLFLLDPIGLKIRDVRNIGFINSYLKMDGRTVDCDMPLFLLFKKCEDDGGQFSDFLTKQYNKNDNLIEEIDCETHVILTYCIPDVFAGDYELFLNGKYSKFSRAFKSTFTEKITGRDEYTFQYRVIHKIPSWKEEVEDYFGTILDKNDELWTKADMSKETLNTDEFCITASYTNE